MTCRHRTALTLGRCKLLGSDELCQDFAKRQVRIIHNIVICSAEAMPDKDTKSPLTRSSIVRRTNVRTSIGEGIGRAKIRVFAFGSIVARSGNAVRFVQRCLEREPVATYLLTPTSKSLSCLPHSHQSGNSGDGWARARCSSSASCGRT